ncbi:MAG: hypothetical protein RL060_198 [Bacteroidota bacterium]|jgi:nucleotide-binding universal stress UspA family protein
MKTILIPTDFSDVATNATNYALDFSCHIQAKIILFHAYHRPFLLSSLPLVVLGEELEKVSLGEFNNELAGHIRDVYVDVTIECYQFNGTVVDGIQKMTEKYDLDYIIMGISGVNKIKEMLIGSNVISVIQAIKNTVLVIPQEAKFKSIEKCVFAYNYIHETPTQVFLELKCFCEVFKPQLFVFGKSYVDVEKFNQIKLMMEDVFCEVGICKIEHVLTFSEEKEILEEINNFVDFVHSDCLVMMHKHSESFEAIFHRDNTTIMPFHTHLPLLVLQEN